MNLVFVHPNVWYRKCLSNGTESSERAGREVVACSIQVILNALLPCFPTADSILLA